MATTNTQASQAKTILLVDDEGGLRRLLSRKLTGVGHAVLVAASGEEALAIEAQHSGVIDLLVTDIMMPGMSGVELAKRLLPRRPKMLVLYISGYAAEANERLRQMQNAQLLLKPFQLEEFMRTVERALIGRPTPASVDPWG